MIHDNDVISPPERDPGLGALRWGLEYAGFLKSVVALVATYSSARVG